MRLFWVQRLGLREKRSRNQLGYADEKRGKTRFELLDFGEKLFCDVYRNRNRKTLWKKKLKPAIK